MKPAMMILLLVIVLSFSIAACSDHTSIGSSPGSNTLIATSAPTVPSSIPITSPSDNKTASTETPHSAEGSKKDTVVTNTYSAAIDSYKDVLQNKLDFVSTDDHRNKVFLNDFVTNEAIYATGFNVTHFTVVDMDGDDIPEVVLELTPSPGRFPEFYEVLHYMDGAVYGYIQVYRGLEILKTDGTFRWSSGASYFGYGKLSFGPDACETINLGYLESSQKNDVIKTDFMIDNKAVTEEAYNSFANEQDGKLDAIWHEFSQENVETELSLLKEAH
jgi:hypothetical protein